LIEVAYAMGTGAEGAQGGGGFGALVPLILMFVIFYFLLIRPQQKKQKEHRKMIENLQKGDQILTTGGIYGRITGITDNVLTVEIAEKVRVKVARGNIAGVTQADKPASS
jgi:preprotein translocase subunit YajC